MRVEYYQGRGRVRSHGGVLLWLTAMLWLAGCGGGGSPDSPSNDAPEKSQVNTAPVFTSGHSVSVPDNSTLITRVTASDAQGDPITYRLAGGIDAELFDIDTQSGELRFKQPADFEAPADSNRNNVYAVAVAASDGDKTAWQALDVSVVGLALTVEVKPDFIKTLRFDWTPLKDATYYKLFVNADSESGYTQAGEDITATPINVTIPVHLTDWVNRLYLIEGHNDQGLVFRSDPKAIRPLMLDSIGYVKASNTDANDVFGLSVALSADGQTMAVGAPGEASVATGVDGDQGDNTGYEAGAVYVYARTGAVWTQQAYIKASNTDVTDHFGSSVALSADGQILAVGAPREDGAATGVDGEQGDNEANEAGAVYVYMRTGAVWTQQAYIKASNTSAFDNFGTSVALSADGETLVAGAPGEDSAAIGVDGEQNTTADDAGAAYVYTRTGAVWTQQAYIKASNPHAMDKFGTSIALSADGDTLVAGAPGEDSAATGVDGEQSDNRAVEAGALYVYTRRGAAWSQQAYLKASNTDTRDSFGSSVALSADGQTLVVGAPREESAATGIGGNQGDNTAEFAGAAYVYTRTEAGWTQQAYLKASNTDTSDLFGSSVALSADGRTLVAAAPLEDSAATGVDGEQSNYAAEDAGAVYVYARTEAVWIQKAYLKASNTDSGDKFGTSVALSADGQTVAAGAPGEDSAVIGVDGDQSNNESQVAGAIYLF